MDSQILTGAILLAAGILFVLMAAITDGEAYEYVWGLFFAQWGVMLIVTSQISSGPARVGTKLFFVVAQAATAYMWWNLRREAVRKNRSESSNSSPQP